ncbi:AMP-binding protein [Actinomadura sp. 7K534]|uniref:AMP-binding protein n=1 Tax=Actinomadura sp. 7K534 TaxID=2530366 RepID=UPI001A9F9723|nr:AMP-binding protein [Actinomadura sp. 7K534]
MTPRAWLFDVDGTLLDSVTGTSLRPLARELLTGLRELGVPVLLWSAGGADYARRRAEGAGIADLVTAVHAKAERDGRGHWVLPALPPEHAPAVLVDDLPGEVPPVGEVLGVPPYVGPNPRDTGLAALLRRLPARDETHPRNETHLDDEGLHEHGKDPMNHARPGPGGTPADRPLSARLRRTIALDPAAPALTFGDRTYPWAYHGQTVDDLEALLERTGARRIGIVLRNRPALLSALLAVLATGREVVTLSPFHGDVGLAEDIAGLAPQVVIADPEDWARNGVTDTARAAGAVALQTGDDRALARREVDWTPAPRPAEPSDVAVLMLTSGTTGKPKRVELTYTRLTAAYNAAGTAAALDGEPRLRPGSVILWTSLVHIAGLYFVVSTVLEGRTTALLEKFEVDAWASLVRAHRPKIVGLPPTAMRMVMDAEVPGDVFDGVRGVLSGTAPLDPADAERFEARYGVPVLTNYGATEFAGAIAGWHLKLRQEWGEAKRGSVGRAHPGIELRIVDPATAAPLGPGETGILEARGAQLPAGGDDWTRTTDLASLDEDGFLYIHGRADDAINRGGFKIVPSVIEDALKEHPAVFDAAAVGLPDPRLGEVPVVAVTLRSPAGTAELRDWLGDRLARYHLPAEIKVVDELPRTPSMKISRPGVRALFDVPERNAP